MEVEALEILAATALHQATITVEAAVMVAIMAAVRATTAVTTMAVITAAIITTITTTVAITMAITMAATVTHQLPTLHLILTTGGRYTRQYTTRL